MLDYVEDSNQFLSRIKLRYSRTPTHGALSERNREEKIESIGIIIGWMAAGWISVDDCKSCLHAVRLIMVDEELVKRTFERTCWKEN